MLWNNYKRSFVNYSMGMANFVWDQPFNNFSADAGSILKKKNFGFCKRFTALIASNFTCVQPIAVWHEAKIVINVWYRWSLLVRWPKWFRWFHFRMEQIPCIAKSYQFHGHQLSCYFDGQIWEMHRIFASPDRLLQLTNAIRWHESNMSNILLCASVHHKLSI